MRRETTRADPRSIRHWNEYAVVKALREGGGRRISELAAATGLTPAPLGQVLRSLESKGWVVAGSGTPNGRGRPAQTFTARVPEGCVLGLDLGAHTVRAVRLDLAGNVLGSAERPMPRDGKGLEAGGTEETARAEVVAQAIADCGASADAVWLSALAVGGSLAEDGRVLRSVAMPEWEGRHPAEIFADALPGQAMVVNDVRAATWAEHAVGAAAGHPTVLLAQLGRRPTLGLLFDDAPWRGAHGTAGDLSLNSFLPAEESMDWLAAYRGRPDPIGAAVHDALAGDETVREDLRAYVERIAPALALATAVVDPSVLVIGGALAPLAGAFLEPLAAHVRAHVQRPPEVVATGLDQFAAARGAALLGLREIDAELADPTAGVLPLEREVFAERRGR